MQAEQGINKKTIIITGGTTGIGRATAILLAQKGYDITIFGRHANTLQDTLAELKKVTDLQHILGLIGDVTKYQDIKNIFQSTEKKFGRIDVLVNNASLPGRSIIESSQEEIEKLISTNITGYIFCAKEALDRMLPQKGGHIINIGSLSAIFQDADTDLYTASKSAVEGFSASLRKKINHSNIKLTEIQPGSVSTNMISESKERRIELEENFQLLMAEDIAQAVYFALSQPQRCEIMKIQLKPLKQFI